MCNTPHSNRALRILTNMTFWQSEYWRTRTDSIYPLNAKGNPPPPYPAWKEAWILFRRAPDYDVVLTMGIRESMAYGLLCLLFRRPAKQVMTEVFIDNAQPRNPLWRMKTRWYGRIARRAHGIITNSSAEIESISARFDLPEDRLRFVPLNATIEPQETTEATPPFILSAGRTLRDYDLIVRAAHRLPCRVTIICGPSDLRSCPLPDNVELMREIDRPAYLKLMRQCAIVALPLLPAERSTGQVVLLEAMAMGKPVITTRAPGTTDYIRKGENGFLIGYDDTEGLTQRCCELMDDPALRQRIGNTAREDVRNKYLPDMHAQAKLGAIWELCGR